MARKIYSSPLKRALLAALREAAGQGIKEVTQDSLAASLDRSVTASFRWRMAELERDGLVERFLYPTHAGRYAGYKVAYRLTEEE